MLMLTEGAAQAIRALSETPGAEGLRIAAGDDGATAAGLEIALAAAPETDDSVLEAGGAQLFLSADTVELLSDKVLDADLVDDQSVRFSLLEQDAAAPDGNGPPPGDVA